MGKMLHMKQGTGSASGAVVGGWATGIGITLVGAALCAALISTDTIPAGSAGYCTLAILLGASVMGAMVAAGKGREKRLYLVLAVGMLYLLTLLAATAMFFDGQYQGIAVTGIVIFSGSVLGALPHGSQRKRTKLRKSKNGRR